MHSYPQTRLGGKVNPIAPILQRQAIAPLDAYPTNEIPGNVDKRLDGGETRQSATP